MAAAPVGTLTGREVVETMVVDWPWELVVAMEVVGALMLTLLRVGEAVAEALPLPLLLPVGAAEEVVLAEPVGVADALPLRVDEAEPVAGMLDSCPALKDEQTALPALWAC